MIARKLSLPACRSRVRASPRAPALEAAGAEIAPRSARPRGITEACRGMGQIVSTANDDMGKGETSPTKTMSASTRPAAPRPEHRRPSYRLRLVSRHPIHEPVDVFRVKWNIETRSAAAACRT